MKIILVLSMLLLFFSVSFLLAQAPQDQPPTQQQESPLAMMDRLGEVLLLYLVLAVVFEAALTPLFSWRVFLERCDGKGLKVPIAVTIVFIALWKYDLDIFPNLLAIFGYSGKKGISLSGQILTALLIAGGSDGVLRIFTKIGIRNPLALKGKAAKAQPSLTVKQHDAALIKTNGFDN